MVDSPWSPTEPLLAFLDATPDAVVVADPGGTVVFANRQACGMFGRDLPDLTGASIDALIAGHAGAVDARAGALDGVVVHVLRDAAERRAAETRIAHLGAVARFGV